MTYPHDPVMVKEILEFLEPQPLETVVDGTVGAAGHASTILTQNTDIKRYIAFDQDDTALDLAKERLEPWKEKTRFFHESFFDMKAVFEREGLPLVDAILLDIGVSSMQLDTKERGFTFREDGPLDMRMDQRQRLTAKEIVNRWPEKELGRIFREYGEEWRWRPAARAIVEARQKRKMETTEELLEVLVKAVGRGKKGGIHPATRIFQALRIAVNDELGGLERALPEIISLLAVGGIVLVISFHSLEDRIVKFAFREVAKGKESPYQILTKKPLTPSKEEERRNRRARSAKLRVLRRER